MEQYIGYRREFHHFPENGWREIRTSARIAEILEDAGYSCLMGDDVVKVETIGLETLTPEEMKAEMARAVEQGAKPEYVERTKGYPGVIAELDTGKEVLYQHLDLILTAYHMTSQKRKDIDLMMRDIFHVILELFMRADMMHIQQSELDLPASL